MTELSHPWLRGAGVILAGTIVFLLDIDDPRTLHQLWLPLCLAGAAYLITQSAMAVAIAAFALAAAHSNPEAESWIHAKAYPGIALISLVVIFGIAWQRFRVRIKATHEARWAARRASQAGDDRSDQTQVEAEDRPQNKP